MNKHKEIPFHGAHTHARMRSPEQLCYIISWRPFVSSDVSGLQRHSGEGINIMSKSRFHACSGETLTSTVYYSFRLKQSRKRISALLTQHMTVKTRWCLFDSPNIQNMISFTLSQMDFLFSKTNLNDHVFCARYIYCVVLKTIIFLLLYLSNSAYK